MIKAVIFDLDHTLFDRYATLKEISKCIRDYLPVNKALNDQEIAEIMITADKEKILYGWEAVEEYVTKSTNLFCQPIEKDSYFNFILDRFFYTAVPFPFTIPMLDELKNMGLKVGLITNGREGLQEKKLEMLGLNDMFDFVLVSGKYNCPKPSLKPFKMMSEWLNLPANQMMYVGDHPLNDVDSSRKAGYIPVFVNTAGRWGMPEIERCEHSVETVADIPDLVKKLNK